MPLLASLLIAALPALAAPSWIETAEALTLTNDTGTIVVRRADGALLRLSEVGRPGNLLSAPLPLWQLRGEQGVRVEPGPATVAREGQSLTLRWDQPEALVTARLEPADDGLRLSLSVTARGAALLDLVAPGRLRFAPGETQRLIMPSNGNDGVGLAFRGAWFAEQPQDQPAGYSPVTSGGAGYEQLFGGSPEMRPLDDPPVNLTVTPAGAAVFSESLRQRLGEAQVSVFRPSRREQVDEVLIDSASGPYLVAKRRGAGRLWRLGGRLGDDQRGAAGERAARAAAEAVAAVLASLPAAGPRQAIALLDLAQGPNSASFSSWAPEQWREVLSQLPAVAAGQQPLVMVENLTQLDQLLAGDQALAIINPYGEWLPCPAERPAAEQFGRLARYVEAGGNWVEVAGYSFHALLRPSRYLNYSLPYPAAFADFVQLDGQAGRLAVFREQPRDWQPWAGAADQRAILAPGRLACGSDAEGGWAERGYSFLLHDGQSWTAPPVRLLLGAEPEQALAEYARVNDIGRPLASKLSPELWAKLRASLLVYLNGSANDKRAALAKLPVPTLIHFADYLHGGFDKQYPDHLPPNERFGTPAELAALFTEARAAGHLISPYTNPTWWCDDPPGPTFVREGRAPLLLGLDGQPNREQYGVNPGWTITFWHPAVRAANEVTRRQFTVDYPVDILFQDQCGARQWHYDLNPASPSPAAYAEGLVSMVDEDAAVVPLGTEAGWDRVVNGETLLCGLSWSLTTHRPDRNYGERWPLGTFDIYPLAQRLARPSSVLMFHDLGQFCEDEATLAWALGLGFSLSWRCSPSMLDQPAPAGWLAWLDRLQKSLVGPELDQPVTHFEHQHSGPEHGLITARYGATEWTVNLDDQPKDTAAGRLAPYGWAAASANVRAAAPADGPAWVAETTAPGQAQAWIYARAGEAAELTLPAALGGTPRATIGNQACPVARRGANLALTLPESAEVTQPPAVWPGREVAVLDLGQALGLSWSTVSPAEWIADLTASTLGAPRVLRDGQELLQVLAAGPGQVWAIINPYGENLPAPEGRGREVLDALAKWVNAGGVWWETGGYNFYRAGGASLGTEGLAGLGVPVGGGEVDQTAEALAVTATGREWLGPELAEQVARSVSAVNRGLPRGSDDPGHVTLVSGQRSGDFIGGYRLNGYGWLWRVGGLTPNPAVVRPVVVRSLEYLAGRPVLPRLAGGPRRLWQVALSAE